jgi:hypothetical protein
MKFGGFTICENETTDVQMDQMKNELKSMGSWQSGSSGRKPNKCKALSSNPSTGRRRRRRRRRTKKKKKSSMGNE